MTLSNPSRNSSRNPSPRCRFESVSGRSVAKRRSIRDGFRDGFQRAESPSLIEKHTLSLPLTRNTSRTPPRAARVRTCERGGGGGVMDLARRIRFGRSFEDRQPRRSCHAMLRALPVLSCASASRRPRSDHDQRRRHPGGRRMPAASAGASRARDAGLLSRRRQRGLVRAVRGRRMHALSDWHVDGSFAATCVREARGNSRGRSYSFISLSEFS